MAKPKILAIDDEKSFTEILKQYFELRKYDIDVVSNGEEGLKTFLKKKHDVVLLDLKMSGLNGDEIMKRINEINKDTKTIFITAFNDSGQTRARLIDEGAYAYIDKPVSSLKELEILINEAVSSVYL